MSAVGLATILGFFYYGYAPFSLVAGVVFDRIGLKVPLTIAAVVVGIGAMLFATGNSGAASVGRFLQGAAGVFASVGALYIASNFFPASRTATMNGATQMFGMAGGSAGQFAVAPLIAGGLAISLFWIGMGIAAILLGILLFIFVPRQEKKPGQEEWFSSAIHALKTVFSNPQSILCGLIAGLLFIPTTILGMVWGVRFLQEAHGVEYGTAVMQSAAVPLGWIIGCPLLGFISDKIGRRRPVIISGAFVLMVCLAWILFGRKGRSASIYAGPRCRHCLRLSDGALHRDQRGESTRIWRHRHWSHFIFEFFIQRTAGAGFWMDPAERFRKCGGGA